MTLELIDDLKAAMAEVEAIPGEPLETFIKSAKAGELRSASPDPEPVRGGLPRGPWERLATALVLAPQAMPLP